MMKVGMGLCAIYFVLSVLFFGCRQSRFTESDIRTLSKLKYNPKPKVIIGETSSSLSGTTTLPLGGSSEVVSRPSGSLEEGVLDTRNEPEDLGWVFFNQQLLQQ